ncbi:MAG: class II aldolase/adducin family protein [Firmicutes bacterium]|nr:class II aldolase/adducin family protein [Bacillota bacterium]
MLKEGIQEIIEAGKRLATYGLIHAHSGNISSRFDKATYLITASGVFKGDLSSSDVLIIDDKGFLTLNSIKGKPSSEVAVHMAIYKENLQIGAIIHAHPPYATALACAGKELDLSLLEESKCFTGLVQLLPRISAGSLELAQAVSKVTSNANALLLRGHGVISWGANMEQALCRMETIEHIAKVMLMTELFVEANKRHV